MLNDTLKPIEVDGHWLWPDGFIQVNPNDIVKYTIKLGPNKLDRIVVSEITDDIKQFNRLTDNPVKQKTGIDGSLFPPKWCIPEPYKLLDVDEYLLDLSARIEKDSLFEKRLIRLSEEIAIFKQHKLDDVLRTLIYIVDEMKRQNTVWGVGRGSSCSSYILYLIGLHEIDVVKYDIDISDFIRET